MYIATGLPRPIPFPWLHILASAVGAWLGARVSGRADRDRNRDRRRPRLRHRLHVGHAGTGARADPPRLDSRGAARCSDRAVVGGERRQPSRPGRRRTTADRPRGVPRQRRASPRDDAQRRLRIGSSSRVGHGSAPADRSRRGHGPLARRRSGCHDARRSSTDRRALAPARTETRGRRHQPAPHPARLPNVREGRLPSDVHSGRRATLHRVHLQFVDDATARHGGLALRRAGDDQVSMARS